VVRLFGPYGSSNPRNPSLQSPPARPDRLAPLSGSAIIAGYPQAVETTNEFVRIRFEEAQASKVAIPRRMLYVWDRPPGENER